MTSGSEASKDSTFEGTIREAGPDDATTFADLLYRCPQAGSRMILTQERSPDPFLRLQSFDEAVTLVVEKNDRLRASGTCGTKTVTVGDAVLTAGYITDIAVGEDSRGRGYAKAMLQALEEWAIEQGADLAYAYILSGNDPSLGLFEHVGYDIACEYTDLIYPLLRAGEIPDAARRIADWDSVASLRTDTLSGYDLVRPLDGESLRTHWTSHPAWRENDVWTTEEAVLGLLDYSKVKRFVPLQVPIEVRLVRLLVRLAKLFGAGMPVPARKGEAVDIGVILGGFGDEDQLGTLLRGCIGRARQHDLDLIVHVHDTRVSPGWTDSAFSLSDSYTVVTKSFSNGPLPGDRPVWIDPLDI